MSHFAIFCPPVPGHLNPLCALGRALVRRGHRVSVCQVEDLQSAIHAEGLSFIQLRSTGFPAGTLGQSTAKLASLRGLSSLKFAIRCASGIAGMILEQAPEALRRAGVEALLVDQNEPAGGTVAQHLGLPFASICTSLPLNREPFIPPQFTGWNYQESLFARARNWTGYAVSDRLVAPIQQILNRYRRKWGLTALKSPEDSFSKVTQIAQMPAEFDFPRIRSVPGFYYCGPWFDQSAPAIDFPFHRLDGRPLIYGSLGTLQRRDSRLFGVIAEACCGLDAQLVLSLGSTNGAALPTFPGNPVVVNYAPQVELLSRAAATITHGGMNTTQQALFFGSPLVAVPLTHDQPAIAARLARAGAGIVLPHRGLKAGRLRQALESVLSPGNSYLIHARRIRDESRKAGGVERAATVAEMLTSGHIEY